MALKFYLDDVEITTYVESQYNTNVANQITPEGDKWFDLMPAIAQDEKLAETFFNAGIHTFTIEDTARAATAAKIWLRQKYTITNR